MKKKTETASLSKRKNPKDKNKNETLKDCSQSICNVRKELELGCKGCVLYGYRECPESRGDEPFVGKLYTINNKGTYGGRSLDGYVCHTRIAISDLKYELH